MKGYFKNFWHYRYLLYELVQKGIVLKYRRSYLGIIWSLLEPILTTIVLTLVFGTLFGNTNPQFPLYILIGRLLYSCFSTGTKGALRSIRANAGMIKKVYVPKYLYPLSSVLFNYVIFLLSLIVLFIWGILVKAYPNWRWFGLLFPLLVLLVMTFGVGMILATVAVFFRDMEYLWDVLLMIVMYTCAIFYYPDRLLKSGYSFVLQLNPLYGVVANARHIVFAEPLDWGMMAYAVLFALGSLLIGLYVFNKHQDEFILYI
ncbi:MAG: ABC transporter permease [Lachnospiraceae bacterium]|nr:ABC transporter permease [Lachnospiraceae bacterium]